MFPLLKTFLDLFRSVKSAKISNKGEALPSEKLISTGKDAIDRARVVAIGIETFMELASRGVFPGW